MHPQMVNDVVLQKVVDVRAYFRDNSFRALRETALKGRGLVTFIC